ncbi:uncharacterized protein LOC122395837 [Colletes gigas]|uniref:uncharacterized protein LOC122395837 n=1 Tax=Colletes gigas TaxID=935657 RepID=UPI001C9A5238|nr:uncharacterized protein LOC122395837 [Colletes gigas]
MKNSSLLQNNTERPSALVCIAYSQLSAMTGIKDPTEPPKVEEIKEENKHAILKLNLTDLKIQSMQTFLEFSKEMMQSFKLFLDELKVQFEQYRNDNQTIVELLTLSNLHKWTQREQ